MRRGNAFTLLYHRTLGRDWVIHIWSRAKMRVRARAPLAVRERSDETGQEVECRARGFSRQIMQEVRNKLECRQVRSLGMHARPMLDR